MQDRQQQVQAAADRAAAALVAELKQILVGEADVELVAEVRLEVNTLRAVLFGANSREVEYQVE